MSGTQTHPMPSGPKGMLRTAAKIVRDPFTFYDALKQEYGETFTLHTPNGTVVVAASPETAKQVFSADPTHFKPFAASAIGPILGENSLLTLQGKRHKRERKLLMPAFHGARMRDWAETIVSASQATFERLEEGEEFRVHELTNRLSLELIVRLVFGVQDEDRVEEVTEAVGEVLETLHPLFFFSTSVQIAPFGLGPWAKFERARERFVGLLQREIDERRHGAAREDILGMMMRARDEEGEAATDEELQDELVTLLMAGHETTAVGLSWAFYRLHRSPETLARLRASMDDAERDLVARSKNPYLQAVCKETLRLYPIVPDVLRDLIKPLRVGDHEVQVGYGVAVAVCAIHHDPTIYPEPHTFKPSRFLEKTYSAFEFMPFGGGHRRCIGAAFAMFEMALALDVAMSGHDFEMLEPEELYPKRRNVTFAPETGVRMRYVGRRATPTR